MSMHRVLAVSLFVVALLAFWGRSSASPAPARKAVIVELFTAEGCSSCPPADNLLGRLREERPEDLAEVIPLGFHVDYWNDQGWRDQFSSAAYTERQQIYARTFRTEGPYTPQMIVDGEEQFVGSDAAHAVRAITQASGQVAPADIELSWAETDKVLVRVKAQSLKSADVLLAITEDNLSTEVKAGENKGHTLRHSAVVREFRRIGQVKKGDFEAGIPLKFDAKWKRTDLRVVVFVQASGEGKIQGAASLTPKS